MDFTMSRALYNILGDSGLEVRDDYSGRYMYGKRCFGFVSSGTDLNQFYCTMHAIAKGDYDTEDSNISEEAELFFGAGLELCWDGMGCDMIFYFPYMDVEADPDVEYDEDEDEEEEES